MKIYHYMYSPKLRITLFILILSSFLYGCKTANAEIQKQPSLKYYPVIYNGTLLGGAANIGKPQLTKTDEQKAYIDPAQMSEFIVDGEEYKLYNDSEYVGTGIGGKVIQDKEDLYSPEKVEIKNDKWTDEIFSVDCDWDCTPRKASKQTSDIESEKVLKELLIKEGITNPDIDILQEYKIDIDGDSVDEVLLSAENKGDKNNYYNKGDFTIIVLRKTINGEIKNIIIKLKVGEKEYEVSEDHIPDGAEIRHFCKIKGFYDVDGDGEMEILIESAYMGGVSYEIYKVMAQESNLILFNKWGI